MSDVLEFGFESGNVIKNTTVDFFKQTKSGEKTRVSIISFQKVYDIGFAKESGVKGSPLTDSEKAEIIAKIDKNLAEQYKKPVSELTEADRLDISRPKFAVSHTHYKDGVGSIKCASKYEGNTVTKPNVCCEKLGDAEQMVGVVVMTYPVKDGIKVDEELLAAKKYVNFYMWRMNAKKYMKIRDAYAEAKSDDRLIIDLIVTLDGDPKYQKQQIVAGSNAVWARGPLGSETRQWVLNQGLKLWKHVPNNLGYDMKMDKLLEKLGQSPQALESGNSAADTPRLVGNYDSLLG